MFILSCYYRPGELAIIFITEGIAFTILCFAKSLDFNSAFKPATKFVFDISIRENAPTNVNRTFTYSFVTNV